MNEKTKEIISQLMNDPAHYKKMSEKENMIWGRILSDKRRKRAVDKDHKAAKALALNRNQIHLPATLRKHNIKPLSGLSLACGNGRAERLLMKQGICKQFHGVDIAEVALATARSEAGRENLNITYEQADLNTVSLQTNSYDLVVTQNCLHHILKLEYLAEQIKQSLRPAGVLWITDYVGETQFQYSDKRLEIVNRLLSILPKQCRYNKVNNRDVSRLERREPGTLVSPFEAIRSGEIIPVFLQYFDIVEKRERNSIMKFVCPPGTRQAFNKNDEGRALFEVLMILDELLISENILEPVGGSYLLRPKPDF